MHFWQNYQGSDVFLVHHMTCLSQYCVLSFDPSVQWFFSTEQLLVPPMAINKYFWRVYVWPFLMGTFMGKPALYLAKRFQVVPLSSASSVSSPISHEPSWEIRFLYWDLFSPPTEMEDLISSLRLVCRSPGRLMLGLPRTFLLEKMRLTWWWRLSSSGSRFALAEDGARITNWEASWRFS